MTKKVINNRVMVYIDGFSLYYGLKSSNSRRTAGSKGPTPNDCEVSPVIQRTVSPMKLWWPSIQISRPLHDLFFVKLDA